MALSARLTLSGGYQATSGPLTANGRVGSSPMPTVSLVLADGTGVGQANQVFSTTFSIAATTFQTYDLKGGGGELDVLNTALAMTAVKCVIVQLDTPASGTSVRFGPQNRTNAAQLWFQDVTANFYETIPSFAYHADARAGWALDSTHKTIHLYNPGGATIAGTLLVIGTK